MLDFYCIGSINLDSYRIIYGEKEKDKKKILKLFLGGSASNTIFYLNMLYNTYFSEKIDKIYIFLIGLIGNDENGQKILNQIREKNIPTDFIREFDGNSGKTDIILDEMGERIIFRHESVSKKLHNYLSTEQIQNILKKDSIRVHVKANYMVIKEILRNNKYIFSTDISGFCKEKEIWSIFNKKDKKMIEILFGNEEEFSFLLASNYSDIEPEIFLKMPFEAKISYIRKVMIIFNSSIACIKKGANGALVVTANKIITHTAYDVNVIDTTGAGDAFNAAFIFSILTKKPLEIALKYACALGSLNCTVFGAQNLDITFTKLINFLEQEERKKN